MTDDPPFNDNLPVDRSGRLQIVGYDADTSSPFVNNVPSRKKYVNRAAYRKAMSKFKKTRFIR